MAGLDKIALVLLAAGHSRRFGAPKLTEPLLGRPLAHHAAATLGALPFLTRIAVTGADDFALAKFGFEVVGLPGENQPMSVSLRAGLVAARSRNPAAVMIALADMPFVKRAHVESLASAFDGERIASSDGAAIMPPAIFSAQWFDRLAGLQGDKGARALLDGAPVIVAAAGTLTDIDSPEQLRAAEAQRIVAR